MATLWSCAIAVVLGLLITQLAGRRAGAAAALLSGLLSTAPVIEGFAANGELMATLPALVALALTARWQLRGGLRLMLVAGLFAGAGVLVKQSGYDGGLAAGLWLLLAAWRGWRPAGEALRALGALALGVALIVGRRGAARRAHGVPRLVVRGRRLPALGRERRDRIGLVQVLALHRLAAHRRAGRRHARRARPPGPLAGAAQARDRAARDLVRALADAASRSAGSSTATTTSGR